MLIQCDTISYAYGERNILNNVSFEVAKGRTLAIVGSSGSGKSTLLRLLAGILPSENGDSFSGSLHINNMPVADYVSQRKLAFMFQEPALFPNLSVRQNIELPFAINGIADEAKVEQLIATVGLSEHEDYLPARLSGGMKTRAALARSFALNPDVLLLDEPFSSLDVAWKDVLYSELTELTRTYGTTVVLVTHDIEEALKLADTIICLGVEGEIIMRETNAKREGIQKEIESLIISDHKLRKQYEQKTYIPAR